MSRLKLVATVCAVALIAITTVRFTAAQDSGRATVPVDVFSFGFNPATVTINVGDTVEWSNSGGFHNVASTDGTTFRCADGCDSTGGNGNASSAAWSAAFTFDTPGVYDYICEIHPGSMRGTITVEATVPEVFMNEMRIDQSGADDDEYVELFGAAGESLDGLSYLVIGDGAGASGSIEAVVDLTGSAIPASGYFVMAEGTFTLATANLTTTLNFENSDNVTHLLVAGFSGALGDDLDIDDDGTLDATPWTDVIDALGLVEATQPPAGGEYVYAEQLGFSNLGPDGSFVPGHAYRLPDGDGRVPTGAWRIGFFAVGISDTPGEMNAIPTAVSLGQSGATTSNLSTIVLLSTLLLTTLATQTIWYRNK